MQDTGGKEGNGKLKVEQFENRHLQCSLNHPSTLHLQSSESKKKKGTETDTETDIEKKREEKRREEKRNKEK
tara:strand:- start:2760 stop:2975 length:216 start_codon:yes stop_codon:yes gene_type:complete